MKKLVVLVVAAMAVATLFAGTVAWYHFDELPDVVGNGVKAGTTFVNSTNAGTFDGIADSVMSTGLANGDWVVKRSDAWNASMLVRDPATGAGISNGKSLVFGSGTAGTGVIRIPDTGSALPTANFTVEFFVRLDNAGRRCVLVSRGDFASGNYWFLEVSTANKLQFAVASGGTVKWAGSAAGNIAFNDDKWHHVAIRRDGIYWAAYLDYAVAASLQPGVADDFLSGQEIVFGRMPGNGNDAGLYNCPLDELRISDVGLGPAQMLYFTERDYGEADGVVSHLRFDTVDGYVVPSTFDWARHPVEKATLDLASGGTVAVQNVNAAETVNPGFRETGAADRGSLLFTGDATSHASGRLTVPNATTALGGDFTVETFFKTSGAPFGGSKDSGYLFEAAGQWRIRFLESSGDLQVLSDWTSLWQTSGYADGEWHHIAFAYDAANDVARVYLDYALAFTRADWALGSPTTFVVGGLSTASNGDYTFSDLSLDEFRVTSRVLSPAEFLTSEYVSGPTLFHAGLDGDLSVAPESALAPDGVASGSTGYAAGAGLNVRLADKTVIKEENPASLSLASGATVAFSVPLVCVPTNTVEFFVKPSSADSGAPLVTLSGGSPSSAVWSLGFASDGETLVFRAPGQPDANTGMVVKPDSWRHVALVVAASESGNASIKVSVDGGVEAAVDLGCPLGFSPADPKLIVGGTGFAGRVDELRISEGELPAGQRMTYCSSGFIMTVW